MLLLFLETGSQVAQTHYVAEAGLSVRHDQSAGMYH